MGYRFNCLDEPAFVTVSKSMQNEFGIHHKLESCAQLLRKPLTGRDQHKLSYSAEAFIGRRGDGKEKATRALKR